MKIEKKCWPDYFEKVLKGEKPFDVRIADFDANPGDILILKEWDPKTKEYTGRVLEKEITYISRTKNFEKQGIHSKEDIEKYGFIIMALK